MVVALAVAVGTLVAAEPLMAVVHRFLFHGRLWCSHKSHHEHPNARGLVENDLLWVWPLATSAFLVAIGGPALVGLGIGIALYVAAYVLAHDGVAHGRFWVPELVRRTTLLRVISRTHRLHHRGGRDGVGAAPFGIFVAHLERRFGLGNRYRPPTMLCQPSLPSPGSS